MTTRYPAQFAHLGQLGEAEGRSPIHHVQQEGLQHTEGEDA